MRLGCVRGLLLAPLYAETAVKHPLFVFLLPTPPQVAAQLENIVDRRLPGRKRGDRKVNTKKACSLRRKLPNSCGSESDWLLGLHFLLVSVSFFTSPLRKQDLLFRHDLNDSCLFVNSMLFEQTPTRSVFQSVSYAFTAGSADRFRLLVSVMVTSNHI